MGRETLEPQELAEPEDFESPGERQLSSRIALTVAVLAVLASLSSLEAERTVSESMLAKNDAVLSQARASDEWSYRQAKSIKLRLDELGHPGTETDKARAEITASEGRAREAEAAREEANRRSTEFFEQHHRFARAMSLLQIAIVLETVAAVMRRRSFWYAGMALGACGATFFAVAWIG